MSPDKVVKSLAMLAWTSASCAFTLALCVYEKPLRGNMNSDLSIFGSALQSEDDVGKVIRTHIFIESAVADFLDAALCDSSHLKSANLDYFQKVHIALACGLRSDLKGSLKFIGTLRNGFAHKLNRRIDKQSMNNLYKELSSELRTCSKSFE